MCKLWVNWLINNIYIYITLTLGGYKQFYKKNDDLKFDYSI